MPSRASMNFPGFPGIRPGLSAMRDTVDCTTPNPTRKDTQ